MKKTLVMLLMGAMLFTACGQTASSPAAASEPQAEETQAEEAEAPAEEAEAPAEDAAAAEAEAAGEEVKEEVKGEVTEEAAAGETVAAAEEIEETAGELDDLGQARTEQEGYVAAYEGVELQELNASVQNALSDGNALPDDAIEINAKDETEEQMDAEEAEEAGQADESVSTINIEDLDSLGYANVSISASSTLYEKGYDHSASKVLDGYVDTAWVEGVSGYGVGEYLRIGVPKGTVFHGIGIISGYQKSEDLFWKNSAPTSLVVGSGDVFYRVYLNPKYGYYEEFDLGSLVSDGSFYVFIDNVRPGTKYKDTCISELWAW